MSPARDRPGPDGPLEHLDRFRELLGRAEQPPEGGWPAAIRDALGPLHPGDATGLDTGLSRALNRLALLAEVWDCLDPDDAGASAALHAFFSEAIGRLIEGLTGGALDEQADRILRDSDERWGAYLAILDPAADPPDSYDEPAWEPGPDPEPPAEDAGVDAEALLRALSGMIGGPPPDSGAPVGPEAGRPAPAAPRPSRSEPEPGHHADAEGDGGGPDPVAEARGLALDDELRAILVADLTDLLARIQELVLGLGRGDDPAALHELGRCYHTLKGASGSVGLTALAARIHALEDAIEAGGGAADGPLIRRLEDSLALIEGTLQALREAGHPKPEAPPAPAGPTPGRAAAPEPGAPATTAPPEPEPEPGEGDGLIRVPAARFEELMDLCSELLTRRRAWAEQAGRMARLALSARDCSQRLRASVDRLEESLPVDAAGGAHRSGPLAEALPAQVRRLIEQAEDLAALAATAREAAIPMAGEAEDLSRLSLRLWEGLQSVRIVPVRGLFQRLIRVARDAARVEGRSIEVQLIGEQTGADRLLLDRAYEPLLHVVRNAVGHGIEPPDDRRAAGKAPEGRVTLEARREGNTLVLEVRDDGRGLDYEAIAAKGRRLGLIGPDERPSADRLSALIFHPGFSTRGRANAVSGRGVGMDVVAREVEALRGRLELTSEPGRGTRLAIRLPARIALEHMMVVRVRGQAFAVPTSAIDAVHRASAIGPGGRPGEAVARVEGRTLPMIDLGPALGFSGSPRESCPIVLVVGSEAGAVALRVDGVDGPRELVLRPLGPLLAGNPAVSGAGVSTGGEVIPALDVAGLLRLARDGASPAPVDPEPAGERPVALVVDDSLSVRRIASRHLRALGFEPEEASDGEEALGKLRARSFDLVLTDLEMPRMDGFALLAELRRTGLPGAGRVVVTSSLCDEATRRRVLDLGAAAFVPKPVDPEELAAAVGPAIPPGSPGGAPVGAAVATTNPTA